MTDDKMRTLLAERICGWHKGDEWPEWLDKDGDMVCDTPDWHPETDLMQAMMVAEALRLEHGWEYVITAKTPYQAGWTSYKGPFNFRLHWVGRSEEEFRTKRRLYGYEANADALPRAIFMAAAQVTEAMETE